MIIDKQDEVERICNTLNSLKLNVKSNNAFISDRELKKKLISLKKRVRNLIR